MTYRVTILIVTCILGCSSLLPTGRLVASPPAAAQTVTDRLSSSWLAGARHIRTATRLILYHSQAADSYSTDGKDWIGKIKGEVLVLQKHVAQACPSVRFLPDGAINVTGSSNIVLDGSGLSAEQAGTWHKLFAEKSPPKA